MGIIPGMGVTEHESASGSKYYEYGGEYYNNYDDIPFATKQAYETTKKMVGDYFTTEWNKIPEPGQHLLRGAAGVVGKVFNYADEEFFYGGVSETLSAVDKGFTAASEVIERETGLYAPTAKVGSELAVDYLLTGGGGKGLKGLRAVANQTDNAITSAARTLFPQPEPVLVEGLLQSTVIDKLKSSSTVIPNTMYPTTVARTTATKKLSGGGLPPDDPAVLIRNLDAEKVTVNKAENLRKQQLIESGQLKPKPKFKLKTSEQAEKYYGLKSKELKEKYGFRYNQYGSSADGDFQLKSLKVNAIETKRRGLTAINVTESAEINKLGKAKWDYINSKLGMEAHHIVPLHVSTKLKDMYLFTTTGKPIPGGLAKWKARVARDAKNGIYHGNHRRNIVAVRGSSKEPLTEAGKQSVLYHRRGIADLDLPGYHKVEGTITWNTSNPDLVDLTPYRDIKANQHKQMRQADKFWYELIGKERGKPYSW